MYGYQGFGYLPEEMTLNSGFVVVNGVQMKNYYNEEHDAGLDCNNLNFIS